jgi:hypothetical protein
MYALCNRRGGRWAVMLAFLLAFAQLAQAGRAVADPESQRIPTEEYPILDAIVQAKFLTSATRLVKIERATTIHLHPDAVEPPTEAFFLETGYFEGRLRRDLVREFVVKNQRPSRMESRFNFGVAYRFVSPEGIEEPEASLSLYLVREAHPVQEADPVVDRLAFSRVAFTLKNEQALAYVANNRPDGTGAGFLVWLSRQHGRWQVFDTEVVWVARPNAPGMEQP